MAVSSSVSASLMRVPASAPSGSALPSQASPRPPRPPTSESIDSRFSRLPSGGRLSGAPPGGPRRSIDDPRYSLLGAVDTVAAGPRRARLINFRALKGFMPALSMAASLCFPQSPIVLHFSTPRAPTVESSPRPAASSSRRRSSGIPGMLAAVAAQVSTRRFLPEPPRVFGAGQICNTAWVLTVSKRLGRGLQGAWGTSCLATKLASEGWCCVKRRLHYKKRRMKPL